MTAPGEDLYRILQVDPAASPLVIQAAYRVLAQIFHPDVAGDEDLMKRLNGAWEVLKDPDRRRRYDLERDRVLPASGGTGTATGMAATPPHAPARSEARAPATPAPRPAGVRRPDEHAGPPPEGPSLGPVMKFGRYEGWSLGQIARVDREFLEWLRRVPAGRGLKHDIDLALRGSRGASTLSARRKAEPGEPAVHTWAPGARTAVR